MQSQHKLQTHSTAASWFQAYYHFCIKIFWKTYSCITSWEEHRSATLIKVQRPELHFTGNFFYRLSIITTHFKWQRIFWVQNFTCNSIVTTAVGHFCIVVHFEQFFIFGFFDITEFVRRLSLLQHFNYCNFILSSSDAEFHKNVVFFRRPIYKYRNYPHVSPRYPNSWLLSIFEAQTTLEMEYSYFSKRLLMFTLWLRVNAIILLFCLELVFSDATFLR